MALVLSGFTGGGQITIEDYFSDTATTASGSSAGSGCIEEIYVGDSGNTYLDFTEVQTLV